MSTMKSKALAALLALAPLTLTSALLPTFAMAQSLPTPYVSRALDAVLLPVDDAVIGAFGLAAGETGVLVLAVQPGGVAEAIGVEPGDVISAVRGFSIADPVELDAVVYYWIGQNQFDFAFDGWRAGSVYSTSGAVTSESYFQVIEITTVETWTSYSYESFSYSEYYAEYSEEITESYETSESYIEEYASSEEFTSEVSEDATDDAATDEAVTDEAVTDEADVDEAVGDGEEDGMVDSADADATDDGTDEAVDDGSADDGTDAAADDADNGGADDDGGDDGGGDDGGGEGEE